jgi:hypothetical protein
MEPGEKFGQIKQAVYFTEIEHTKTVLLRFSNSPAENAPIV